MNTYAIETHDLTKKYRIRETKSGEEQKNKFVRLLLGESFKGRIEVKDKTVVDHVNLSIKRGECFGVLGPNGAGKSTLFEILSTGILPDEGTAKIMGYDIIKETTKAKGYITPVFPMFGANYMWTGRQNLEYEALLYNIPKLEMKRKIVAEDTPANLKSKIKGIETIDLEVLTYNKHNMIEEVKTLKGVEKITSSSNVSDQIRVCSLKVHTLDSRSLLPSLIDVIHRTDGKVRYVKVSEPTLEDVFIHYTGKMLSE